MTFTTSPYNLQWGQSVFAQVVATNIKGSSLTSLGGNGAVILTNPDAPLNFVNVALVTTGYQIGLSWTQGLSDGGTPVLDYKIMYDQATNNYVTLDSSISALTFTAINLTPGLSYSFKIESRNAFGYSLGSTTVVVLAAQYPDTPLAPTTTF